MTLFTPLARRSTPPTQYVGDADTGIVHLRASNCSAEASELFLDLRTAVVRGYRLCACCQPISQYHPPARQLAQKHDRN